MKMHSYPHPQTELTHHGIKGQRWGVRRYQNEDGTLTDAGKKRYNTGEASGYESRKTQKLKKDISRYEEDINSWEPHKESGIYSKNGKLVYDPSDIKKEIEEASKLKAKAESDLMVSQKRDTKKAEAQKIKSEMSIKNKAVTYTIGGVLGPTNYANYKAAGYSDKQALGATYLDWALGRNLYGRSSKVRNKAADKS